MKETLFLVELKEDEVKEEEGACGEDSLNLEDSSVGVVIENEIEDPPQLSADTELRIVMALTDSTKSAALENTARSGGRESLLRMFQLCSLVDLIYGITVDIKENNTVKKMTGYVSVLTLQSLQNFYHKWYVKERLGEELPTKVQCCLDQIRKTFFLDLIENQNGSPIRPSFLPNPPLVNVPALCCLLKAGMVSILRKVQRYSQLSEIPINFINLRPVLVGIRSKQVSVPRMDLSDMYSFLYWCDTNSTSAKDLYDMGLHCLDPARKLLQCLLCGKKTNDGHNIKACCGSGRLLKFDEPITVATIATYLDAVNSVLMHPPSSHLQSETEIYLCESFIASTGDFDVSALSKSGLSYTGDGNTVRCYSCGVLLENLQRTHNPILSHAAISMHCRHILQICGLAFIYTLRQKLLQAGVCLLGYIGNHMISYPEFRTRSAREQTCTGNSVINEWIKAGFFFKNLRWICFCCGIELMDISDEDDPWAVHFEKQPNCPFLLESRQEYIAKRAEGKSLTEEQMRWLGVATEQETENTNGSRMRVDGIPDDLEISASQQDQNVRNLILSSDEDELERENDVLRQQLLCKICEDKEVQLVFLPCGHIVCCEDCAPALIKCPACRTMITGLVKAYF